MSEKERKSFQLPYNVDLELFDKILADLKNTGSDGIKQDMLWVDTGAAKNSNRSYTLNLVKYLKLVETENTRVWLTKLGVKCITFATGDDRRTLLAKSMPEEYLAMFKWIRNEQELKSNEIKQKFIEAWEQPQSIVVLDKAIASFLNYCQYLKLIKYVGKGNQARAIITDFGKAILDGGVEEPVPPTTVPSTSAAAAPTTPPTTQVGDSIELSKEATYPIIIKTRDRDFDWDIKSVTDWAVIDSVIKSIREGWEKTHQKPKEGDSKGK